MERNPKNNLSCFDIEILKFFFLKSRIFTFGSPLFGCMYNEYNVLKFLRDGLVVQGAGCNFRTQKKDTVDKFQCVVNETLKEEVKTVITSLAQEADDMLTSVASNTADRFRSDKGCRWKGTNPFSTCSVVIDHYCAPHKASIQYI